ncbi:endonuclease domain-containing protein [Agrococcus sp. ARC_14]|uniref:endonuclease domain-containing protein n=1 Tax=Agrococcus sp. ARC_14 TaxID=2919927 RepID=UPI001F065A92|nr:endonuclease domain-containing protein [Agrococcus sp. ARC_14]MCH1883116.1 endonuclease domain-containing protein [Agrococcus sp. ARC_14]
MDSSHGFTVRDGLDRGYTSAELRSMAFTSPARGTRITAAIGDEAQALFEAVRVLALDDQFFSHSTAARIHGMPLPTRLETDRKVHLSSPTGRARMQRPGVVGHRLKSQTVEVDGVRVESRPDVFVHLATMLTVEELVMVGDWLVSPKRRAPLTVEDLRDALRRYDGARGLQRARHALSLVRVGAESPRESLVRLLVTGCLPEPTLQHEVFDPSGTFVARLDLSWPRLKLGVEYDGEHHTEPEQHARDQARIGRLRALGWHIITVTKHDLEDGGTRLLAAIVAAHRRYSTWTAA